MILSDYIKNYENVLDDKLCDEIIENSKNQNFDYAEVANGKNTNTNIRVCYVSKLDKKFEKNIYESVHKILMQYKNTFKYFTTGLSTQDTGYEHLLYLGKQGGNYAMHVDHYDVHPRVLSISFILNDNYDGGDFVFFEKNSFVVKKKKGSAVVFPSNFCFPHAIKPVSKGDRHSIITWIH